MRLKFLLSFGLVLDASMASGEVTLPPTPRFLASSQRLTNRGAALRRCQLSPPNFSRREQGMAQPRAHQLPHNGTTKKYLAGRVGMKAVGNYVGRLRITKILIAGMLAMSIGGEAVAETDRLKPRIECGDTLPKGKTIYNGRRHRELVGPVAETKPFGNLPGPTFIMQRYAIIKRSKCWVSFWSFVYDDTKEDTKRMTGTFSEPQNYSEGPGSVPFGGRVGSRLGTELMAQVDKITAECEDEYNRVMASLPKIIPLRAKEDIQANIAAVERRVSCLDGRAKALDKRGFIGLWYSEENYTDNIFAVVDGKLHVRMAK